MRTSSADWNTNLGNIEEVHQWARSSLFETIERQSEGTVIVDADARVVWINTRYAERFGFPSTESAVGRKVEDVIPGSLMPEVVRSGRPMLLDVLPTTKEPLVVMRFPIKDNTGKVIGAIGFALFDEIQSLSPIVAALSRMRNELASVRKALAHERHAKYSFSNYVCECPSSVEVKNQARRAATLDAPVLLLGETGTGKEVLAHAIHAASARAHKPLVSVNMGAIPESLLEVEFFGAAPGAYTGAQRTGRIGKLQLAEGGTLFLDEIGDLPLSLQGKLLRVLQEKEFEPIGSNRMVPMDIRIIAATAADLPHLISTKAFRADLYYRLNVLPIAIPPLRKRLEDIRPLANALLTNIYSTAKTRCRFIDEGVFPLLEAYNWPGNVRELRNILERAVMLTDGRILEVPTVLSLIPTLPAADAPTALRPLRPAPPSDGTPPTYEKAMGDFERELLINALNQANGSAAEAANHLGIGRSTLYKKMVRHNISL